MGAILTLDLDDEGARENLRKLLNDAAEGAGKAKKETDGWTLSFTELNQALELGKKAVAAIKYVAVELTAPLREIVSQTAEWANNLTDLSEATGISTDTLQTWTYAAEQTGISADKVTSSMNFFTRQMSEAVNGNEELAGMFKGWGIELLDSNGILRDSTDVMAEFMDIFSQVPDNSGKNALAMKLFGKSASEIVPFLNLGSEGIARFAAEMDLLQLRVSTGSVAMANQYSENLEKMAALSTALGHKLGATLIPAITVLSDELLRMSKEGLAEINWGMVTAGASEVVRSLGGVAEGAALVGGAIAEMTGIAVKGFHLVAIGALEAAVKSYELVRATTESGSAMEAETTRTIVALKKKQATLAQNIVEIDAFRDHALDFSMNAGAKFVEVADKMAGAVQRGSTGTREMASGVKTLDVSVQGANKSLSETQEGITVMYGQGRDMLDEVGESMEKSVGGGAEKAAEKVIELTGTVIRAVGTMNAAMAMTTMGATSMGAPTDTSGAAFKAQMAKRAGKFYQSGGSGGWAAAPWETNSGGGYGQGDGTTGLAAAVEAGVILPGQASDLMAGRASAIVGQRFNDFQAAMARSGNASGGIAPGLAATARVLDDVITKNVALEQGFKRTAAAAASVGGAASSGAYRSVERTQDFLNRSKRDGSIR